MKTTKIGHGKNSSITTMTFLALFLVASIYYLCATLWTPLFSRNISYQTQKQQHLNSSVPVKDHLEKALSKASMPSSKTVIITIINKAYVEPFDDENGNNNPSMLDLFLEGFWEGEGTRPLVDHLLVVAMDRTAYERCVFRRLHCYGLDEGGGGAGMDFSGEKIFMSKDFINMMWRRTLFLLDVLKRGYNFIFTDTDIIWLRNPFLRLSSNTTEDFQISTDIFTGDPWSTSNPINTGFYYVKSNIKTITLFETWYSMRKNYSSRMKEQDILAIMKRVGVFKEMDLVVRYLDVLYFNGFCTNNRDVSVVTTVHANCCRSIGAKVIDLKNVLRDWKAYKKSRFDGKIFQWTEHISCKNSWGQRNKTLG